MFRGVAFTLGSFKTVPVLSSGREKRKEWKDDEN